VLEETVARTTQRLRTQRLQIMLNAEELLAVDDFHDQHIAHTVLVWCGLVANDETVRPGSFN
jgi:hypothetical protein